MIAEEKPKAKRKPSRQRRRYHKTQDKILTAARSMFAEKGIAASIEEIVEQADIGRGSFYYHFENKEDLIQHMVQQILTELIDRMRAGCDGLEDLDPMLDAIIGAHIDFFRNRWNDFVLYSQSRAEMTLGQSYEGLETPFFDYLQCIEELVDSVIPEPITDARLRRLAFAIAGFISGYYSFASVAAEEEDVDKSFLSLRSAFVASLSRFIKEALPQVSAEKDRPGGKH
jgi:AcrR family transcriptional regulator